MTTDLDRALIALRVSRDHGHGAVLNDAEVPALLAEIDRLTRERAEARAALESIAEGCSFPADDVQRAIRDRARAALAQIEQERSK